MPAGTVRSLARLAEKMRGQISKTTLNANLSGSRISKVLGCSVCRCIISI